MKSKDSKVVNRRDFLVSTAALAGAGLPTFTWAASRPCPPGALSVRGGSTISSTCPALAGDLPTLTVSGSAGAWTFGQPFKKGAATWIQGPTGTQVDIRNRWPDGSAKFAVISGVNVGAAMLTAVSSNPYGSGHITTSALASTAMQINFGASAVSWSSADWGSPFRAITSGPVMSSWVYRKAMPGDAHLVGWLEVRAYSNGQVEVLPWIENGYLNVAGPTAKSGRAVFVLNGVTKYDSISDANTPGGYEIPTTVDGSGVLTMPHHTRAVLVRGGASSHWSSGAGLTPTHDRTYLTATKFVPAYYATSIDEASLAALTTSYNPGRLAYTTGGMGGTGYAPDIGLLPNAAALYLCSGDARAYRAAISCGFSLSNYCIHYRDEATNRPLRFSQHPNTSINSGVLPPTPGGGAANRYASSHHPAAAYLPYLLTGWDWFVEEMLFQVTDHYLARSTGGRKSPNYYFYMSAGGPAHNENSGIRAVAWQWRTAGMATALTPDGDVLQAELKTVLNYNATKFRTEYETGDSDNPYGPNNFGALVRQHEISTGGFGLWHVAFWCASLGLVSDIEPITDATARTDFEWLTDFGMKLWGNMLGPTGNAAKYGFVRAANYAGVFLGEPTGTSYTWFTTMGEAWTRSWGSPNTVVSNTLVGGNIESGNDGLSTSYWGNLQPAIAYSVDRGSPGALEGYNRMIGSTNWAAKVSQFNAIPVWGVKPRSF